jgi:hypothetical protein
VLACSTQGDPMRKLVGVAAVVLLAVAPGITAARGGGSRLHSGSSHSSTSHGSHSSSHRSSTSSREKTVHVDGHTRKDGNSVRPHGRQPPSSEHAPHVRSTLRIDPARHTPRQAASRGTAAGRSSVLRRRRTPSRGRIAARRRERARVPVPGT